MSKTALVHTPFGDKKMLLPTTLGNLRQIFGPTNVLYVKSSEYVISGDNYELQENVEYYLKPPMNAFPSWYSPQTVNDLFSLDVLNDRLKKSQSSLHNKFQEAVVAIDKLPEDLRSQINTNSLNLAVSTLREARLRLPDKDSRLSAIDQALIPLFLVQRALPSDPFLDLLDL